ALSPRRPDYNVPAGEVAEGFRQCVGLTRIIHIEQSTDHRNRGGSALILRGGLRDRTGSETSSSPSTSASGCVRGGTTECPRECKRQRRHASSFRRRSEEMSGLQRVRNRVRHPPT